MVADPDAPSPDEAPSPPEPDNPPGPDEDGLPADFLPVGADMLWAGQTPLEVIAALMASDGPDETPESAP